MIGQLPNQIVIEMENHGHRLFVLPLGADGIREAKPTQYFENTVFYEKTIRTKNKSITFQLLILFLQSLMILFFFFKLG
jgi:hypothetical protein